ncbi:hypothetical protein ACQ4PT_036740 [Festuca glaucescens]
MKAEPKVARLLEKAGFTLRRNNRIPPPPAVCEAWWRQSEDLIKKRHKARPKFGLGYIDLGGSDDEKEGPCYVPRATCHATSVSSGDDAETSRRGLHQRNYNDNDQTEVGELDSTSAPQELEDGGQPTIDELVEVNLGTEDDPRPTFVSATLTEEEREGYRSFLMEYRDCFAWNYKEMPGLDPRVATHKLAIDPHHRPVVKGQALAEFLAAHPVPDDSLLITNLTDEEAFAVELEAPWELYFDGASRTEVDPDGTPRQRAGVGLVFKTPQGGVMYHSFSLLKEECSNNEAEYEALIFGLLLALSKEVRSLRAYGDSQLIVRQVNDIYEVRKPKLVPYYNAAQKLMEKFQQVEVLHVSRSRNAPVDALAKLASALVLPSDKSTQVMVEERWLLPAVLELVSEEGEVNTITTNAMEEDEWLQPFLDYFKHGSLPDDPVKRRQLQQRLPFYVYKAGVLYRRSHGQDILLRCVNREVQLPSLRVAIQDELTKDEQVHLRFQELDALEEERLHALQNLELYRQNMVRAYHKLVKRRVFRKDELVLVLRRPIVVTHKTRGKFEPKWEGPYAIEQVYDGGAYQLVDPQGARPMPPINGRFLKKYFC